MLIDLVKSYDPHLHIQDGDADHGELRRQTRGRCLQVPIVVFKLGVSSLL